MLAPIVLAAGRSTRMGTPKALLRDTGGRSFVARLVRTFGDAGLGGITVVTGVHDDAIRAALEQDIVPVAYRVVRNPDPDRGQLSSLWTGMDAAVDDGTRAILVTLVDVAFVSADTVRRVIAAYDATNAPIVRPAIGEHHGHPVIFDRSLFGELRAAGAVAGAKEVVRRHEAAILDVPVDDVGALLDVDTPADYESALREFPQR